MSAEMWMSLWSIAFFDLDNWDAWRRCRQARKIWRVITPTATTKENMYTCMLIHLYKYTDDIDIDICIRTWAVSYTYMYTHTHTRTHLSLDPSPSVSFSLPSWCVCTPTARVSLSFWYCSGVSICTLYTMWIKYMRVRFYSFSSLCSFVDCKHSEIKMRCERFFSVFCVASLLVCKQHTTTFTSHFLVSCFMQPTKKRVNK